MAYFHLRLNGVVVLLKSETGDLDRLVGLGTVKEVPPADTEPNGLSSIPMLESEEDDLRLPDGLILIRSNIRPNLRDGCLFSGPWAFVDEFPVGSYLKLVISPAFPTMRIGGGTIPPEGVSGVDATSKFC